MDFSFIGYIATFFSAISAAPQAIKTIKTDKSLLPSLNSDNSKIKGFNTVIQAIQASGSLICVEGVETVSQLELSVKAGCTLAQGYLFGKPMTACDFEDYYNYDNSIFSKFKMTSKNNNMQNKKIAIVFDEIEIISLSSEKKFIFNIIII